MKQFFDRAELAGPSFITFPLNLTTPATEYIGYGNNGFFNITNLWYDSDHMQKADIWFLAWNISIEQLERLTEMSTNTSEKCCLNGENEG